MKKTLLSLGAIAFLAGGIAVIEPAPAQATWWGKDKAAKSWDMKDHWAKKKAWWQSLWLGKTKR